MSENESGRVDVSSVTIVRAVSDATGRIPAALPPLQRSVDVDALEALVSGERSPSIRVSFDYAGVRVDVDRNGLVATERPR